MRRLSSPGHARQVTPWLWLVATILMLCVVMNVLFMVTWFESDEGAIDHSSVPAIAPLPAP